MHAEPSPRQLKLRTKPLSVVFSPLEEQAIKQAAYHRGETVSTFIRTAAVRAAKNAKRHASARPTNRAA